jgi:hypothetical protein
MHTFISDVRAAVFGSRSFAELHFEIAITQSLIKKSKDIPVSADSFPKSPSITTTDNVNEIDYPLDCPWISLGMVFVVDEDW